MSRTGDTAAIVDGPRPRSQSVRSLLRRILREPLTHFLGIATILFFGLASAERQPDSIEVDRAKLVQFMQERARIFDAASFSTVYDRLTPAERAKLVGEYAMSEALYRSAEASGLDRADPLIRQRMIQQMRLLLQDQTAADLSISDAEARAYFESHQEDYARPATLTFTHVFVDRRKHGHQAGRIARETLRTLQRSDVAFEQAGGFGDLFPYRRNYIDVSGKEVGSELGEAVADRLFSRELATGSWQGPFGSDLGEHLVLVKRRQSERLPDFTAVAAKARDDALFAKRARDTAKAADAVLRRYSVRLADDVGDLAKPAS